MFSLYHLLKNVILHSQFYYESDDVLQQCSEMKKELKNHKVQWLI